MRTVSILVFSFLFLIAGCAEVPRPTTFHYSGQQQLQSATHWREISKNSAARLYGFLNEQKFIEKDQTSPPIYILASDESPFGMAFRSYLITELMQMNPRLRLTDNPDEPFAFTWEVQLVNRSPNRPKPFFGVPAFIVELVGFILVGGGWNTTDFGVPHTEFILTTNVRIKDAVFSRYSDTFFINDGDWRNYVSPSTYAFSRSIAGKQAEWKMRLASQGMLSR